MTKIRWAGFTINFILVQNPVKGKQGKLSLGLIYLIINIDKTQKNRS